MTDTSTYTGIIGEEELWIKAALKIQVPLEPFGPQEGVCEMATSQFDAWEKRLIKKS